MVLQYCDEPLVNTMADILFGNSYKESAKLILEHIQYGEFDSAVSLFNGKVEKHNITVPHKVYDELLSCYSLDPQDLDYSPDMYADVKAIEEAGLVED